MLKTSSVSILKWTVPAALFAVIYYPTFLWMAERWMARDSYFGHGFLIPLVTLYWIWKKRKELSVVQIEADPKGLFVLCLGIAMQLIGSVLRIYFLSAFSLVFILVGAVHFLFGFQVLRLLWFPLVFLMLMIPLPLLFISEVTLKMKFFVSEVSVSLLNAIGIPAVREGSYLYTKNSVMMVGDPCSGLRSFLAFLCLGLVFAYDSKAVFWKKLILVAAGLPLAILSNVVRVFSLGLLSEIYGQGFVTKEVHDASGVVVFILAFVVLLVIRHKLEENHETA